MSQRILVTGGTGLVGRRLQRFLPEALYISSSDYDLTDQLAVDSMFRECRPTRVIHLAARVGGIVDNMANPAAFYASNFLIDVLMLRAAARHGVERFTGCLSTCAYPDVSAHYPMTELDFHVGPPPRSNFSHGYAKRAQAVGIDAFCQEHGFKWNYFIPSNIYGANDKVGDRGHFVAVLLDKIHQARQHGRHSIMLMGDGSPLRQFIHVYDLCWAISRMVELDITDSFNLATDEVLSIRDMAHIAIEQCAPGLQVQWDTTKPNGQFRKDVSIDRLRSLMPDFRARAFAEGVQEVYREIYSE